MEILIVSDDGFEEAELLVPYYRLQEPGHGVTLAAPRVGTLTGKHGYPMRADVALEAVDAGRFDALVLPGGRAPERLRSVPAARELVRRFVDAGKPVAAICHGPLLLAAAGVAAGRTLTAYPPVRAELEAAGARFEDAEAVVDGQLVTARRPADIPAWMRAFTDLLARR